MNGIEQKYEKKIDFRWMDANSVDGGAAFRQYRLVGHPSYVILSPDGQVLWSGLGELTEAQLEQEITGILVR